MPGSLEAMVRNAVLREIVSPDLFRAVPAAHLPFPVLPLALDRVIPRGSGQLGAQEHHCLDTVLALRTLVLALDHDGGGNMGDAYGCLDFIDVLAAGAT